MKNKQQLKAIINYLAKTNFYFCKANGEIFNSEDGNMCYCAEDILQQAHDAVYVAVVPILAGYRIDPIADLTEEAQEQLLYEAQEIAEQQHIRFNSITKQHAEQAIKDNQELAKILFERFSNSAHK